MGNELPSNSDTIESGELSKEDMIDFMGREEDHEEEKETKEDDKEEIKEDKEDKEDDESEDDKKEKPIELVDEEEKGEDDEVEFVTPFRKKELLAKYPTILKEFPYLEKAYYRDQQYTETFATPAEAKEAQGRIEALDNLETELAKGSNESILKAVKERDPKAYVKMVDNYLTDLRTVDPDAHLHVIGNVVKNLIVSLVKASKSQDNPELKKVALAINRFAFESDTYEPPVRLSKDEDEINEVEQEKQAFIQERFETSRDDLDTRVENVLKATISQHMDPRESMTDYVRKTAIKEALENVKDNLDKDTTFRKHLDSLWKRAFDAKFNRDSLNAIKSAYLSKAKTVLPTIIRKHRNEALKGLGKRVREDRDEPVNRGHLPPGRTSTSSTNRGQSKNEIPRGMTTLEFLNKD